MKHIAINPNWRASMEIIIAALEDGTPEGKRMAKAELRELAAKLDGIEKAKRGSEPIDLTPYGEPIADRAPAKVRTTRPLHEVREIAPGLYIGRDDAGELKVIDRDYHRGYVTPWATEANPDGWRVHVWGDNHRSGRIAGEVKRLFPNRAAAERALIRFALKLEAAA